ncbi:hypothetical protein EDB84DRAFT_1445518 [Lactarius hengduanensis]|nr:hypothetical protein EDB84DRAFT_1445518 [Lactarius hengduanensis]
MCPHLMVGKESAVKIRLPKTRAKYPSEDEAPDVEIPGVLHRDLLQTIISAFKDPSSFEAFHLKGFTQLWKPSPDSRSRRLWQGLYFEYFGRWNTIPLMLYSDSTHLAHFCTPRSGRHTFSAHHLAYIPSLPDWVQDTYKAIYEAAANSDKVRDLGTCADELRRVVGIRVDSKERQKMVEKAREWIFKTGRSVTSERIDEYLKLSMVPIHNAFLDVLLCASMFCGSFPKACEKVILDLIFLLATWHALAKLRMHTTSSLSFFESVTKALGRVLRCFNNQVCPKYNTVDTPGEVAKKACREASKVAKGTGHNPGPKGSSDTKCGVRLFNLATYKLHALGHYVSMGEREHRRVKQFYARTNRRAFERQIALHERRTARLRAMKKRSTNQTSSTVILANNDDETLPQSDPSERYHVSHSRKIHFNITKWLADNKDDPAVENFLPDLKDHLLGRMMEAPSDHFTDQDRRRLLIHNNRIFCHKTLRINFTTYDCQRDQDSINTGTRSDIMVLANHDEEPEDTHPYWYARVIGIFHAMVNQVGRTTPYEQMDFLWVRWHTSQARAPFPLGLKLGPILNGIFVSPRNTPRPYLNPGGSSHTANIQAYKLLRVLSFAASIPLKTIMDDIVFCLSATTTSPRMDILRFNPMYVHLVISDLRR